MKIMIYLLLVVEGTGNEPHKLEWMSSSFMLALNLHSTKGYLQCLPKIQASHGYMFLGILENPLTSCFFKKYRCPNDHDTK